MGKRTKYQQEEKAQLVLCVKRETTTDKSVRQITKTGLPKVGTVR